jgi:hypothetical protein
VTDPSKAVVPGATVTLLNIKTGVQTVKITNQTGLYRFDNADSGSHTLTTEMLQSPSGIYSGGGGDWLSAPYMGYGTVQNPLALINHRFFRSVSLFFIQLSAPISK